MERQVNAFLASMESPSEYSASTRQAYASDLRVFLEYLRNSLQRPPELGDLTPGQIALFLQSEAQSGRRKSTLVRRRATLRRFSRYLDELGDLPTGVPGVINHEAEQAIASAPAPPVLHCLKDSQVAAVLATIETSPRPRARRDQAILLLLLETGLPVGTLVRLDLEDVNMGEAIVTVPIGNGSSRSVSLGAAALALDCYLKEGRPELNHGKGEEALFISQMNSRLSRQGLWQILRYWGHRVDPPIDLSPRLVRNTAALRMARAGRPLEEIQTTLGHANLLSTQALIRRLETACLAGSAETNLRGEKKPSNG